MGQWLRPIVIVAVLAAAGWFAWGWLFPDDEAMIRDVLQRIEKNIGGGGAQDGDVGRIARAASLRTDLDPQITIDAGSPFSQISGRDTVIGTAARLNTAVPDLAIRFVDVQVTIAPDQTSANAYMTVEANYSDPRGAAAYDARELDVTFRKSDGAWVIATVNLVRTLEPVNPR